jgi:hypothetical protein
MLLILLAEINHLSQVRNKNKQEEKRLLLLLVNKSKLEEEKTLLRIL